MHVSSVEQYVERRGGEPAAAGNIRVADRMVGELATGGEWPVPELLERIAEQGEVAVLPLAAYIRGALMGIRSREPLPLAIRLLGAIGTESAMFVLLALLRECCGEYQEAAAGALSELGPRAARRTLEVAADSSLPLSNRFSALDASCDAASRSELTAWALGGQLHDMLDGELKPANDLSRDQKQWIAAIVESVCILGYEPAGPAVFAAVDYRIVSQSEAGNLERPWGLSVNGGGAPDPRVPFASRYRGEFNMRTLRASSTARARRNNLDDFDDLDDLSAGFSPPA